MGVKKYNLKKLKSFLNKIKAKTRIRTRIKNHLLQSKDIFLKSKSRIRSRIKLFLSKEIKEDIIKIDAYFPQANPHGFTNAEVNYLFEIIPNFVSYRPYKMTREGDLINKTYIAIENIFHNQRLVKKLAK